MNKNNIYFFLLSTPFFLSVSMQLAISLPHIWHHDMEDSIWYLAHSGKIARLEERLKEGADANQPDGGTNCTPLLHAARAGHANCVELLLKYGANPLIVYNKNKISPLHIACFNGHLECVKALIKGGAQLNWGDIEGNTPLHVACERNCPQIVALLLEYHADRMRKNKADLIPLQTARKHNNKECVTLLES